MNIKAYIASLLLANPLYAAPVFWEVNYKNDQIIREEIVYSYTVTGSFIFDADSGLYSDIDLYSTGYGEDFIGANYTFLASSLGSSLLAYDRDPNSADLTGTKYMGLYAPTVSTLPNTGGILSNVDNFTFAFDAGMCTNEDCTNFIQSGVTIRTSDATMVGTPIVSQVPLPASGLLLIASLGGFVVFRRRAGI